MRGAETRLPPPPPPPPPTSAVFLSPFSAFSRARARAQARVHLATYLSSVESQPAALAYDSRALPLNKAASSEEVTIEGRAAEERLKTLMKSSAMRSARSRQEKMVERLLRNVMRIVPWFCAELCPKEMRLRRLRGFGERAEGVGKPRQRQKRWLTTASYRGRAR